MATPVLMFMNMKGGVGKTTLAVEVGRTLAHEYDKDVLLIDYDPQANASLAFFSANRYSTLLNDGRSVAECLMPNRQEDDPFSVVRAPSPAEIDCSTYAVKVPRLVLSQVPRAQSWPVRPRARESRVDAAGPECLDGRHRPQTAGPMERVNCKCQKAIRLRADRLPPGRFIFHQICIVGFGCCHNTGNVRRICCNRPRHDASAHGNVAIRRWC